MSEAVRNCSGIGCSGSCRPTGLPGSRESIAKLGRRAAARLSTSVSGWRREGSAAPISSFPPTISPLPRKARPGWDRGGGRSTRPRASWRCWTSPLRARISPSPSATFAARRRWARRSRSIAACRSIPSPTALEWQVGEGLRTSMRAVFEAIAHRSPYPQGELRRGPLEPHGAEGALHRLDAGADPGARPARQSDARAHPARLRA